jgi:hypothetical protein
MNKFIAVLLLACVILSGCATPMYNCHPMIMQISEPPLNNIITVQIGETMLRQGKYLDCDALYIKQDIKLVWAGLDIYTFTCGYYLKQGEDGKSEFYLPSHEPDSGHVIKGPLADPFKVIRLDKKSGQLYGVTVLNWAVCANSTDYEKKKHPIISSDSFQQTLIYSGKIGNKINIGYREFSNDLARPAFNNNVEYDLSESKIIGYKGARIEIIEATNEYIKYKVIQNFNKAEY